MDAEKPEVLVLQTAEQFRALALPARFAAFDELFSTQRQSTATELSVAAGVSPSSMSYHLRELERQGMVRRAGDAADGRQRLWEAPAKTYDIVASLVDDDTARTALIDTYLNPMRARMSAKLQERSRTHDDGLDSGETVLATGRLQLSQAQLLRLQAEIAAVWRRYEAESWQPTDDDPKRAGVLYMWSLLRA